MKPWKFPRKTPLVNQTDATVGYVLDSRTIESMPLGTGGFTQIAILSPDVNADFLNTSGTSAALGNQNIWAKGQPNTSNTFTLNAVRGNHLFNGKSGSQVAENRFLLNTGQNSIQHAGGDVQTNWRFGRRAMWSLYRRPSRRRPILAAQIFQLTGGECFRGNY